MKKLETPFLKLYQNKLPFILIVFVLFIDGCASTRTLIKDPVGTISDIDKSKLAKASFETAEKNEDLFYYDWNKKYAFIALEKYEKSFVLSPQGPYACAALLKKAMLYKNIGEIYKATIELKRVRIIPDYFTICGDELKYVERYLDD